MALLLASVIGFVALGVWQVQRRSWKLDLIARLDTRVHAAPIDAPGPAAWASIAGVPGAYARVQVEGTFLNDRETPVQAVTALGGGFWILTPLVTDRGFTVLVNRGFVTADHRDPAAHNLSPAGTMTRVTGLLRLTEPHGAFLRSNDPAGNRWYSRDVAAIAGARGLPGTAPYFIDADATPDAPDGPVGGLTVVDPPNNHLVYALTWFGLAGLAAAGAAVLFRDGRARPIVVDEPSIHRVLQE